MLEIPEITFSRILDDLPAVLRPLFFAKEWEVYQVRTTFCFDGFDFTKGMVMEYPGGAVVAVHEDQASFLTHLRKSEIEMPIELKLALSLDVGTFEDAFRDKLTPPE